MKKIAIVTRGKGQTETEVDVMSDVCITTDIGKQFVIYLRDEGMIIRETSGEALVIHPSGANSILIK